MMIMSVAGMGKVPDWTQRWTDWNSGTHRFGSKADGQTESPLDADHRKKRL